MPKAPTEHQQHIYSCWLANDRLYKPTARSVGCQPEKIRKAVAAVIYYLNEIPPPPKLCSYCAKPLGCRNKSGYCTQHHDKSPHRRKRIKP